MKKYMDIERLKTKHLDGFHIGDHIVVQEKIDGANFSIKYNSNDNVVEAFSRKRQLDTENNLRGAYEWSQKLNRELVKEVLGNNLILFGEWLVKHTVVYPENRYQNAYFYDVFNVETEEYLEQEQVKTIVNKLGLIYVPVFYDGEFESWEHLQQFVGKTELGGEQGEGIVVKNIDMLNNPDKRIPFYTKIVTKDFVERKYIKKVKPNQGEKELLVSTIVTEARVVKLLNKMVDENIIPENWDEHDMKTISQNIGKVVYHDCVKEENDVVNQIGNGFGKIANKIAMRIVRYYLDTKQ